MKRQIIWFVALLTVLVLFLTACSGGSKPASLTPPAQTNAANPVPKPFVTTTAPAGTMSPAVPGSGTNPSAKTGDVKTGTKVETATQVVGTGGGKIAVSKPGDPLDGFVINVPAGSYAGASNFKVTSAPITSQTFGANVSPVSPMIYVDNGGVTSEALMSIRVPVKVPAGSFAMGFLYDEKTRQLEAMPLLAADADSVTVGTRHFSNFFISVVSKALLKSDIDTGFKPGVDDWQFTNFGSFIAPGGHCEGQSMTAMWYYCTKPDGPDKHLYGRYDNNGDQPATRDFWQDDSLGYRFASEIQQDIKFDDFVNKFWFNANSKNWVYDKASNQWNMVDVPGLNDEARWNMFAYALQVTNEPQLVVIWSKAGGGHAMICYRINGGNLYIADPNYPGNADRRIEYANGAFKPYNSGANKAEIDAGRGHAFESIQYYAKSTVLPWDKIAQRWTEFKNKTIGSDKFPAYKLVYVDETGALKDLNDGFVSPTKTLKVGAANVGGGPSIGYSVWRNGAQLEVGKLVDLNPGTNKIGIEVKSPINTTDKDGKPVQEYKYVDFKYVNITYNGNVVAPTPKTGISWTLVDHQEKQTPLSGVPSDVTSTITSLGAKASGIMTGHKNASSGKVDVAKFDFTWTDLPQSLQVGQKFNYNLSIKDTGSVVDKSTAWACSSSLYLYVVGPQGYRLEKIIRGGGIWSEKNGVFAPSASDTFDITIPDAPFWYNSRPGDGENSLTFTIEVRDNVGWDAKDTITYTYKAVNLAPEITTASLPAGKVGADYSFTLAASGGKGPYTWYVIGMPPLPAGLTLNTSTGVISGKPTQKILGADVRFMAAGSDGYTVSKTLTLVTN